MTLLAGKLADWQAASRTHAMAVGRESRSVHAFGPCFYGVTFPLAYRTAVGRVSMQAQTEHCGGGKGNS